MSANGFLNKITVQYSLEHLLETQGRRIEAGEERGRRMQNFPATPSTQNVLCK